MLACIDQFSYWLIEEVDSNVKKYLQLWLRFECPDDPVNVLYVQTKMRSFEVGCEKMDELKNGRPAISLSGITSDRR